MGEPRSERKPPARRPFVIGVDGRYHWTRWRVWAGPWRIYAGRWYRMALDDWGHSYDPRRAWVRVVYGPLVTAESGRSDV